MYLDTRLQTSEERLQFVNDWLADHPEPTENECEWIASYLTYPLDKEERLQERKILTSNRLKTINAHETSYEGMSSRYEAGEDAVEAIIQSKVPPYTNITPKKRPITQWDIDNVQPCGRPESPRNSGIKRQNLLPAILLRFASKRIKKLHNSSTSCVTPT